jgi:hypothetical protein
MQSYKKKNNSMDSGARWGGGVGCVSLLLSYIEEAHTKHTPEEHTPYINTFHHSLQRLYKFLRKWFQLDGDPGKESPNHEDKFYCCTVICIVEEGKKSQL